MNPIPQVDAKIKRASFLINELESLCQQYINSNDFRVDRVQIGTHEWNLILRVHEAPPLFLGILVGDIVHNLRSSLDIAIFHYLQEANPRRFAALDYKSIHSIKFPIFLSSTRFEDGKWHGGLADEQLIFDLREVQPFRYIDLAESETERLSICESSPLWQLHSLWNADKHRGINLVVGSLDMLMLGLNQGEESVWLVRDAPPWKDGSVIFNLKLKSDQEAPALNLSETFAIGLESDIKPLQIYPIVSKLQALLGNAEHCHWVLQRWFEHRN